MCKLDKFPLPLQYQSVFWRELSILNNGIDIVYVCKLFQAYEQEPKM